MVWRLKLEMTCSSCHHPRNSRVATDSREIPASISMDPGAEMP